MSNRIEKDDLIQRASQRTGNSPKTVEKIADAMLEEIYESLKQGECVSLKNFGTFYVCSERDGWVFKFNPSQRLRKMFRWPSTYKGDR